MSLTTTPAHCNRQIRMPLLTRDQRQIRMALGDNYAEHDATVQDGVAGGR